MIGVKHFSSKLVPLTTATLLVLGMGMLVSGVGSGVGVNNVHAETSSTQFNVEVPLVLSITSDISEVNIDASQHDTFYTNSASVVSTTNNPTGYTLTMADKDTDNSLVNPDYDSSKAGNYEGEIGSITSEITVDGTGSNFTVNKWGYAKDSAPTVYKPIPLSTSAEEIKQTTGPVDSSSASVTFGTKVNGDLVSGTYSDTVVFSLTANAIVRDITKLTSMQDLATHPEYCTNSAVGTIKTGLPDERDGQTYAIAKLADGKCWMLDNLALDLTNSTTLNAMDQDNTNASNTTLGYLRSGGGTTSDKYATAGVSNWTSSYSYSAPLVNLTNKDIIPSDATSTAGNYKVGGYYNYCAATAGSYCYGNGTSAGTSSGDATEDICPKGWRLPTGNTSGEFSALANAIYGSTGSTSDPTAYANYRAALHLPFSGYFDNGAPDDQGSGGDWWSSTRRDDDFMYKLYANTGNIYQASRSDRIYGFSVRCIASS